MNTMKALLLASTLVLLGLTGLRPAVSLATGYLNGPTDSGNRAALQVIVPRITKATLVKKDLVVEGENFAAGATVLLNGTKTLKARSDDAAPGMKLVVKKGRISLPVDEVVSLQVKNPDQQVSEAIAFFTGLTLNFHNTVNGIPNSVQVGQIVLLDFDDPDILWFLHDSGGYGDVIEFISSNVPLMPKAQEFFLAKQAGRAFFRMEGLRPGEPSFLWLVNLTIE